MKTKIPSDYHASFEAKVSPQKAFDAICKVGSWWTKNVEGPTKRKNDVFTVTFGETFSRFHIIEMEPAKKIIWLVLDCNLHWMKDKLEWKDTQIEWVISSNDGSTHVEMTHIGLRPGIECFEDCTLGWNHYVMASLFKLITEGKGEPDHKNHSAVSRQ
jgi:hypothetical protein